ncbi:hypothetical protein [uncultured Thiodictyon sp.]|uniref:hypothetical protein n=1 Tax=uncultured Thiodictyon sp. TaxID=1846217 RepID=UPI0025E04E06|nr:hypothetical protein [uncultured Thiodictyon sp.]
MMRHPYLYASLAVGILATAALLMLEYGAKDQLATERSAANARNAQPTQPIQRPASVTPVSRAMAPARSGAPANIAHLPIVDEPPPPPPTAVVEIGEPLDADHRGSIERNPPEPKEIGKVLDADHPYAANAAEAQPEPVRLGEPLDADAHTTLPSENTHPTVSIGPSLNASAFFPIDKKGTAIPR